MKGKNKFILLGILSLIIILVITRTFTYAKYTANSVWDYYLESKGFYFNSDDLVENQNINNNWDGDKTYFKIQNYYNDSLITGYDIDYEVTCTIEGEGASLAECRIEDTSSTYYGTLSSKEGCLNKIDGTDVSRYDKETCETNNYEWNSLPASKNLYFDIVPKGDNEVTGVSVKIEVKSKYPFEKVLTGSYVLNKGFNEIGGLSLTLKEIEKLDYLIVSNTYKENKCVKLSWDANIARIDDSSTIEKQNTDSNGYVNEIIFKLDSRASSTFNFYRTNFQNPLTETAFNLVESDECKT